MFKTESCVGIKKKKGRERESLKVDSGENNIVPDWVRHSSK
jgi:hypothetical protein